MRLIKRSILGLAASMRGVGRFVPKPGHRHSKPDLSTEPEATAAPVDGAATAEPPGGYPETGGAHLSFPGDEALYRADDLLVSAFSRYAGIALFLLSLALAVYIMSRVL